MTDAEPKPTQSIHVIRSASPASSPTKSAAHRQIISWRETGQNQGQASAYKFTRDIRGEARIVGRAFGLGAAALAEAVRFLSKRMKLEAV